MKGNQKQNIKVARDRGKQTCPLQTWKEKKQLGRKVKLKEKRKGEWTVLGQ